MKCYLNDVHISEALKFLAESPSVTTIDLIDPFDVAHLLIIPLQSRVVTKNFDVNSLSIAEYENEDIPKIHLTAVEPPLDPTTKEYSERKSGMLDY